MVTLIANHGSLQEMCSNYQLHRKNTGNWNTRTAKKECHMWQVEIWLMWLLYWVFHSVVFIHRRNSPKRQEWQVDPHGVNSSWNWRKKEVMGCNGTFMGRKFEVAPINFEMGFDFLAFFHINRIINNMFSNHHEDVVKVLTYTSSNFQLSLKFLWFIVS